MYKILNHLMLLMLITQSHAFFSMEQDIYSSKKKVECAVCFEKFINEQEALKLTCECVDPRYHSSCFNQWKEGSCPQCRKSVTVCPEYIQAYQDFLQLLNDKAKKYLSDQKESTVLKAIILSNKIYETSIITCENKETEELEDKTFDEITGPDIWLKFNECDEFFRAEWKTLLRELVPKMNDDNRLVIFRPGLDKTMNFPKKAALLTILEEGITNY